MRGALVGRKDPMHLYYDLAFGLWAAWVRSTEVGLWAGQGDIRLAKHTCQGGSLAGAAASKKVSEVGIGRSMGGGLMSRALFRGTY